jgi:hypothetical protein
MRYRASPVNDKKWRGTEAIYPIKKNVEKVRVSMASQKWNCVKDNYAINLSNDSRRHDRIP